MTKRLCLVTILLLRIVFTMATTPENSFSQGLPIPSFFTRNTGQLSADVKYMLSSSNTSVYFGNQTVTYQYVSRDAYTSDSTLFPDMASISPADVKIQNLSVEFVGKNPESKLIESGYTGGKSNYFYGSHQSTWVQDAPNFSNLTYEELYHDIDLLYYSESGTIKTDFILHPGSKLQDIELKYQGAESLMVSADGDLLIFTRDGIIREHIPIACQHINGQEITTRVQYSLLPNGNIGFVSELYNTDYDLIIDPILIYSTYIGGGGDDRYYFGGVDKDAAGNIYATGRTSSFNFPITPGAYNIAFNGGVGDAFVFKLDPTGSTLIYSTFIGSTTGFDAGYKIKVVPNTLEVVVIGCAGGSDFPVTPGAYQTNFLGNVYDVFVLKLNNAGNALVFSTFLGGPFDDMVAGMAIDTNGFIYVSGQTNGGFPVTPGAYQTSYGGGTFDGFLTKLNANGTAVVFSTYLGGSGTEKDISVAIDNAGNSYLTGATNGQFPVTPGAYDVTHNGDYDVFISKINAFGDTLIYSTYLGGPGTDWPRVGIIVNANNEVMVCGLCNAGYPTTAGSYDVTYNGGTSDMFITRLNAAGNGLIASTYLGTAGTDEAWDMRYGTNNEVLMTGMAATGFPMTTCTYDPSFNGGTSDVVVCRLSNNLSNLLYSTYIGGASTDKGVGIIADHDTAYIIGETASFNFPTTPGCLDGNYNGGANDLFVVKMNLNMNFEAAFSAPAALCLGESITFTNLSYGATSYLWSFGDSTVSNIISPIKTFTAVGSYTVRLIASGSCGNDTVYQTVNVVPIPLLNLIHDTITCASTTITIRTGTSFDTYLWSTGSTDTAIVVSSAGLYKVTVTESGCAVSGSIHVGFYDIPYDIGDTLQVSSQDIIAHYPFNGDVLDYSGNHLDAVNNGSVITEDPCVQADSAYLFNGTGDYIQAPHSDLYNSQPLTISFWFRVDTTQLVETPGKGYVMFLLEKNVDLGLGLHFAMYVRNQNAPYGLVFAVGNGMNWNILELANSINGYTWYHVGGKMRSNKLILYLNGTLMDSINVVPVIATNSDPILIGKSPDYSVTRFLHGAMDDIRFYGRELSACEIRLLAKYCTPHVLSVTNNHQNICIGDSTCIQVINPESGIRYQLLDALTLNAVGPPHLASCDALLCMSTGPLYHTDTFAIMATNPVTQCYRLLDTTMIVKVSNGIDVQRQFTICEGDSLFAGGAFQHATGIFYDTIHVSSLICDTNIITNLTVLPNSIVNQSFNICQGDSVLVEGTYHHLAGNYTVNFISANGCDSIIHSLITVNPLPVLNLPSDTGFCEGYSVVLNAQNPGSNYIWSTGANTQTINLNYGITVSVTVTDLNGCKSIDSTLIHQLPSPQLSVVPPVAAVCQDSSVQLNVTGALTYLWGPATGLSSTTDSIVWANPTVNTVYSIHGLLANGCAGDTFVEVTVVVPPKSQLPDSLILCNGETIDLDAGYCLGCSYQWGNNINTQVNNIQTPGDYWVKITRDGCASQDTILVKECMELTIPNVFTPNGDGKNDTFHPKGINVEDFKMIIFNRWGEQLYETTNMEMGWDGRYKGQLCSNGVYFYLIEYSGYRTGFQVVEKTVSGVVTLLSE